MISIRSRARSYTVSMATRRSGQLKNCRTPTFIVPRRIVPRSVDQGSDHRIRQARHALQVEAVLHDAGREEGEAEVAGRVYPEGGRSRADPSERPRAREVAEGTGDDALAADEEAETDRGRERRPAAHLNGVVEERVRLVAGPVPRGNSSIAGDRMRTPSSSPPRRSISTNPARSPRRVRNPP